MIEVAHGAYWAALGANGMAALLYAIGAIFQRRRVGDFGALVVILGITLLTASLALRWGATGHGPYIGRYEALGSYAWVLMASYLLLQWKVALLRLAGAGVIAVGFLLLGAGVLSPAAPQFESPALRSAWLWTHVGLAKIALASLVLAAGASVAYLRRVKASVKAQEGSPTSDTSWEGGLGRLEELSVRLTSLGFLLLAVVIGAGALWANTAWGSYWSWDPIEVWALATWVLYGLALHLHRLWHFAGVRWAYLSVGTLAASGFLFVVTRLLALSPHWIYLG
ncbi:MAG: cytochrome c biogenesis protein CcsA [Chloroflexi bacterium]|nr:cytochrome c biogenesis protein CcsA [Chloroflexota bacterium]